MRTPVGAFGPSGTWPADARAITSVFAAGARAIGGPEATREITIVLTDGHEHVFSVELHPITGRTIVRASAYEPEELILDGDEDSSEIDD